MRGSIGIEPGWTGLSEAQARRPGAGMLWRGAKPADGPAVRARKARRYRFARSTTMLPSPVCLVFTGRTASRVARKSGKSSL